MHPFCLILSIFAFFFNLCDNINEEPKRRAQLHIYSMEVVVVKSIEVTKKFVEPNIEIPQKEKLVKINKKVPFAVLEQYRAKSSIGNGPPTRLKPRNF